MQYKPNLKKLNNINRSNPFWGRHLRCLQGLLRPSVKLVAMDKIFGLYAL